MIQISDLYFGHKYTGTPKHFESKQLMRFLNSADMNNDDTRTGGYTLQNMCYFLNYTKSGFLIQLSKDNMYLPSLFHPCGKTSYKNEGLY